MKYFPFVIFFFVAIFAGCGEDVIYQTVQPVYYDDTLVTKDTVYIIDTTTNGSEKNFPISMIVKYYVDEVDYSQFLTVEYKDEIIGIVFNGETDTIKAPADSVDLVYFKSSWVKTKRVFPVNNQLFPVSY